VRDRRVYLRVIRVLIADEQLCVGLLPFPAYMIKPQVLGSEAIWRRILECHSQSLVCTEVVVRSGCRKGLLCLRVLSPPLQAIPLERGVQHRASFHSSVPGPLWW